MLNNRLLVVVTKDVFCAHERSFVSDFSGAKLRADPVGEGGGGGDVSGG